MSSNLGIIVILQMDRRDTFLIELQYILNYVFGGKVCYLPLYSSTDSLNEVITFCIHMMLLSII